MNRYVDGKSPLFAFTEEHHWVKLGQFFFDLWFYFVLFKRNSVKVLCHKNFILLTWFFDICSRRKSGIEKKVSLS